MKKVKDTELERKFAGMIGGEGARAKALELVNLLKKLQDAGGLKICMNVRKSSPMYREVK